MELSGSLGGGVLFALAAGLWLVYLVPSWLRRREYLATERNAVRLQQTLRVLAETAEVPLAVRAETSARGVAEQQRTLRQAQQLAAREARAVEAAHRARDAAALRRAERLADAQPAIAGVVAARTLAARRLRRTRALTSLLLLASLVTLGVQVVLMTGGIAAGAWAVVGFSSVVGVTSFALLGRLAAVSRQRASLVAAHVPVRRTTSSARPAVAARAETWTPVPLPKPMYLSRSVMESVVVEADVAVAELQAAAAQSDAALRSAHREPEVAPFVRASSEPAARALKPLDLDEVLRRRRVAG